MYVFCDGPKDNHDEKNVREVRVLVKNLDGFASVTVFNKNRNHGLAKSIISGVTEVVEKHGQVIVFEDDLVSHPGTLRYFNRLLSFYRDNTGVFSISGYSYPEQTMPILPDYEYDVYAIPRMQCWGWATWQDRWSKADFDVKDFGEFNSSDEATHSYAYWIGADSLSTLRACMSGQKDVWACRWVYTHFKYHAVCICPVKSMINNIGLDGTGTNCGKNINLSNDLIKLRPISLNLPKQVFIYPSIFDNFMRAVDPKNSNNPTIEYNDKKTVSIQNKPLEGNLSRHSNSRFIPNLRQFILSCIKRIIKLYSDMVRKSCSRISTISLIRLGTKYGGWWVPETGLTKENIVISAGAGEDISFDLALSNMFGCHIIIMDPTPRARKHYYVTKSIIEDGQSAPINNDPNNCYEATTDTFSNLAYRAVGLWDRNTSMKFFAPGNANHVSHSIDNLHNTESCFTAKTITIKELMLRESIDDIAILKMDIEGAEFSVIDYLLSHDIKPWFLLVEFHPKSKLENYARLKTSSYIKKLRKSGYYIVKNRGWDYVFELQQ